MTGCRAIPYGVRWRRFRKLNFDVIMHLGQVFDSLVVLRKLLMNSFDLNQTVAIAANICVIIGIIFLGIEIRGNTVATQATNIQTASALDHSFLIDIGSDPELSRIWTAFLKDPGTLTDAETAQAAYLFAALVRRLENILLQYELGALSEDGWKSRQALFTGIASTPGYAVFRQSLPAGLSGKAILDYMDQLRTSQP